MQQNELLDEPWVSKEDYTGTAVYSDEYLLFSSFLTCLCKCIKEKENNFRVLTLTSLLPLYLFPVLFLSTLANKYI